VAEEDFVRHLFQVAVQRDLKAIMENKGKSIVAHSSSGHKHALREVLSDPTVASKISETKAFNDVRALSAFLEMLNLNPDRAFYGYGHVKRANDEKAIETLLVTDDLFR
jgi:protein pelota